METKQCLNFMEKFRLHFGYDYLVTVDPIGCSGGLALFFHKEFNVSVLYESKRLIDIEATFKGKIINFTFVYGDPIPKNREQVWERITRVSIARSSPWFLIGDFNELTGNHEKEAEFKACIVFYSLQPHDSGLWIVRFSLSWGLSFMEGLAE